MEVAQVRKLTRLKTVKKPRPKASILEPALPPLMAGGPDEEDLVCGDCGTVLAAGFSLATIASRFAAEAQLLVVCPGCRSAYNVLPVRTGKLYGRG
jgi:hypothetical protein